MANTVFAIVIVYCTAYYRDWFTTQLEVSNWYLLIVHMNTGVAIFFMTLFIILMRFRLPKASQITMPSWQRFVTNISHSLLYSMLLIMPISTYIGTGFDIPVFSQSIMLPSFRRFSFAASIAESLNKPIISILEPFSRFHQDIGADFILPSLMLLHMLAALYHHYALKDATLIRMWPKR